MKEEKIIVREGYIKLGQALKVVGAAESGVDAKEIILSGKVRVNGAAEIQRGKKLYPGDIVEFQEIKIEILKE